LFPQLQRLLLKCCEVEQKQQYHHGVSLKSLLMLIELGKPEHGDLLRTTDKMELPQVPSQMVPTGDGMGGAAVGAGAWAPAKDHEDRSHGCVGEAWPAAGQRRADAVFGRMMSCQHIAGEFKLVNRCVICNFVGSIKQREGKHWGLWIRLGKTLKGELLETYGLLWTSLLTGKGKEI